MKKGIYLPLEEKEVMKIIPSSSGIIIPLDYFGLPKYHVTFFIKSTQDDKLVIDMHVKENGNTHKLYGTCWVLSKEQVEEFLTKLGIRIIKVFLKKQEDLKGVVINTKDKYCVNCLIEEQDVKRILSAKKEALEYYSFSNEREKLFRSEIKNHPICIKPNHSIVYDSDKDKILHKFLNALVDEDYIIKVVNELSECFEDIINSFDKAFNDMVSAIDSAKKATRQNVSV